MTEEKKRPCACKDKKDYTCVWCGAEEMLNVHNIAVFYETDAGQCHLGDVTGFHIQKGTKEHCPQLILKPVKYTGNFDFSCLDCEDINPEIEQKGEKQQVDLHKEIEDLKTTLIQNKTRVQTLTEEIEKVKGSKKKFSEEKEAGQ